MILAVRLATDMLSIPVRATDRQSLTITESENPGLPVACWGLDNGNNLFSSYCGCAADEGMLLRLLRRMCRGFGEKSNLELDGKYPFFDYFVQRNILGNR